MAKEKKPAGKPKTLADFDKKYADRRVDVTAAATASGAFSTGSLKADKALRGGIAKGKMAEIYGPPGSGKTTLALKVASLILKAGGRVVYFDLERGLDLSRPEVWGADGMVREDALPGADEKYEDARRSWLATNGIDVEKYAEQFRIYDPFDGEDLFGMLRDCVQGGWFDLCIVDSVPAIVARKVLEGEPGDATYGARAKLLSEELGTLLRMYRDNPTTTVIFINQVREAIGAQVKMQKSTGGYGLEHFVRVKVKVQRTNRNLNEKTGEVTNTVKVQVEKNIFGPAAKTEIFINSKRGIDVLSELLEFGLDEMYVHVPSNSGWHYFFEAPVDDETFAAAFAKKKIAEIPGYLAGINGEEKALQWMHDHGWEDKLFPLAKAKLG